MELFVLESSLLSALRLCTQHWDSQRCPILQSEISVKPTGKMPLPTPVLLQGGMAMVYCHQRSIQFWQW